MKLLGLIYVALLADVLAGLPLNLFGFGREPLWFTLLVLAFASLQSRMQQARLGMIALTLCCAWLAFYPRKNGFDVVLSPTLAIGVSLWLWKKLKKKK